MASRMFAPRFTSLSRSIATSHIVARSFQTSRAQLQEAIPTPVKKPVGAFRGGLLGFLLGSTLAGATTYYYVLEEYKVSNDILNEDIYQLQAAVHRVHDYVTELENKVAAQDKK